MTQNQTRSTKSKISEMQTVGCDFSLDAVAAAPDHHMVIFENDYVRVLDTVVRPGERVPLHIHRWPSVSYTISSDHFMQLDREGNVLLDSRVTDIEMTDGAVYSIPPSEPHSIENVGSVEIRAINIELKQ